MASGLELNAVDVRIWEEELNDYVPQRIFDIHTHLYRWQDYNDPDKNASRLHSTFGGQFPAADWELANACDEMLMPGREVNRLSFPYPFPFPCDFEAANEFVAQEVAKDPKSSALMLVHPGMTAEYVVEQIRRHGFLGLKPYRHYATTGDAVNCRIPEFMPDHLVEVAHKLGLIIMMHVSKRDAIGDPDNLRDLERLCGEYPNAKWVLAHCARSYSCWAIERAATTLRKLPNLWYDTSSVCESDAIDALFSCVGFDRVMYGSDDVPIGILRGKYIAFGFAWAFLNETNHSLHLADCEKRMTFTRYEQLRAMRRAALRHRLTREQNERMFYDVAFELVESVRTASAVATA